MSKSVLSLSIMVNCLCVTYPTCPIAMCSCPIMVDLRSHIAVATGNMFHVSLTDKSAKRLSLVWYIRRILKLELE